MTCAHSINLKGDNARKGFWEVFACTLIRCYRHLAFQTLVVMPTFHSSCSFAGAALCVR